MRRLRNKKNSPGFTIIEMMVVIAIFLAIITIMTMYFVRTYNLNRFMIEQHDAINFGKKGIESMVKEIREASFAENGDYPIADAQSQSFVFYSDIDSDNQVEKVRYYLENTNLMKEVTKPTAGGVPEYLSSNTSTSTVAGFVRNSTTPIFYYYNGDYPSDTANNPLSLPTNISDIKLIQLYLEINIDPSKAPDDFVLDVFVNLRNIKDNL